MEPSAFSPKVLNFVGKIIIFFRLTNCFPFDWNPETRNLVLAQKSKCSRIYSRVFTAFVVSYWVFLLGQLLFLLQTRNPEVMDIYWVLTYVWGYGVSSEGLVNAALCKHEWVQFFNELSAFDKKFKGIDCDCIISNFFGSFLKTKFCKFNKFSKKYWPISTLFYRLGDSFPTTRHRIKKGRADSPSQLQIQRFGRNFFMGFGECDLPR